MEYVKINVSEQVYAKKELLYSQMEMLTIMKRYQKFKELRKQELALKSILKRKIMEMNEEIKIADRVLPKAKTERTDEEKERVMLAVKGRRTFESEIDEIKRKIERLQS